MVSAHDVRVFANANGIPVSKRGPVSRSAYVAFLKSNPAITRAIAKQNGIPVGTRGRMSQSTFETVAGVL